MINAIPTLFFLVLFSQHVSQTLSSTPFNEAHHHNNALKGFIFHHIRSNTHSGVDMASINNISTDAVNATSSPSLSPSLSPTASPTTASPTRMPFVKFKEDDDRSDDWRPRGISSDTGILPFWLYTSRFSRADCNKSSVVATSGLRSGVCLKDISYSEFASFMLRGDSCTNVEVDVFADSNCTNFLYNKFLRNAVDTPLGACFAENSSAGIGHDAYSRRIDCTTTLELPITTRSVVKLTHGFGADATCAAGAIEFTAVTNDVCFSEDGGYSEKYSCLLDSAVSLSYFGSNGQCAPGQSVHSDLNLSFHQGCYTNGHYNGNHAPDIDDDIGVNRNKFSGQFELGPSPSEEQDENEGAVVRITESDTAKSRHVTRTLEAVSVFKNTRDLDDFYKNDDDVYGDDAYGDAYGFDDDTDQRRRDPFFTDDNFDDAYGLDDDVSLDKKLFESLHCFQLESYEPTVRPTARPTKSVRPSLAPTVQTVPLITFQTAINLTGLTSEVFDSASQNAVTEAVSATLNISGSDSTTFVSFSPDTSAQRLYKPSLADSADHRGLASTSFVSGIVTTQSVIDLQYFEELADPTGVYNLLAARLVSSSTDAANSFTDRLTAAATRLGAIAVSASSSARSLAPGALSIQLPPTAQPTAQPSRAPSQKSSSSSTWLWSPGVIAGVALAALAGVFLLAALVYLFGYYGPRERLRDIQVTDHQLV